MFGRRRRCVDKDGVTAKEVDDTGIQIAMSVLGLNKVVSRCFRCAPACSGMTMRFSLEMYHNPVVSTLR